MMEGQVAVGPEYFKKALRDYADWRWALVREFIQNGVDCGSRNIWTSVQRGPEQTAGTEMQITVENDGEPMDRDTLLGKLLSLGESSKDGVTTVGGFGKAKEILYFAQARYRIESGFWTVTGSGGRYRIESREQLLSGTRSTVWVPCQYGYELELLERVFRQYLPLVRRSVSIWFNDRSIARTRIGQIVYGDDDFEVRKFSAMENRLLVSLRGLPMFSCKASSGMACSLKRASYEDFTANRDQLRGDLEVKFSELVKRLQVESLSFQKTLQRPVPAIRTRGTNFFVRVASRLKRSEQADRPDDQSSDAVQPADTSPAVDRPDTDQPDTEQPDTGIRFEHRYSVMLVTELGRVPHARFWKRGHVLPSIQRLLTVWARVLSTIHYIEERQDCFGVGLVYCDDSNYQTLARYRTGVSTGVYLINPWLADRRLRYRVSDYGKLVSVAAHEYLHGTGLETHDERFAARYTALMSRLWLQHDRFRTLLKNRTVEEFNWPNRWPTGLEKQEYLDAATD